VDCKLAKKSTSIRVQYDGTGTVPVFAKDGPNRLLLTWPSTPEIIPTRPLSNGHGQSHQTTNGNGVHVKSMHSPPPPVPTRVESMRANGNGHNRH